MPAPLPPIEILVSKAEAALHEQSGKSDARAIDALLHEILSTMKGSTEARKLLGPTLLLRSHYHHLQHLEDMENMELSEAKEKLKAIEEELVNVSFVVFHVFEREGRPIQVALTERLRKAARKEGVWRSREMLITLKNAAYGFDERLSHSNGGRDGIFILDRTYRPANEMMTKLFDRFLDRPNSGAEDLAVALNVPLESLLPVRLVSHHMRLLGVLARREADDWLVLVDCDRSE